LDVQRIAAFSIDGHGGNPAGVWIGKTLPSPERMQAMAAEIGFSETAFAAPEGASWRVRYFAPAMEVAFCGHATIALGAALARAHGDGVYALRLNDAAITVEGRADGQAASAALQSPPTRSGPLDPALLADILALFSLTEADLDQRLPPAFIHAGADHALLGLASRERLAAMRYDLATGRALMEAHSLVTIDLVFAKSAHAFDSRNAFASGGVLEDPATGAAAAAFAGYLRDLGWPHGGHIEIDQGVDMGAPSRILADIPPEPGASIRVYGQTRVIG
jgi:PhzF family phenazine biosynthesis protein